MKKEREWNVMDFGARANDAGPTTILREPSVKSVPVQS
jgi:hypothetical protein